MAAAPGLRGRESPIRVLAWCWLGHAAVLVLMSVSAWAMGSFFVWLMGQGVGDLPPEQVQQVRSAQVLLEGLAAWAPAMLALALPCILGAILSLRGWRPGHLILVLLAVIHLLVVPYASWHLDQLVTRAQFPLPARSWLSWVGMLLTEAALVLALVVAWRAWRAPAATPASRGLGAEGPPVDGASLPHRG